MFAAFHQLKKTPSEKSEGEFFTLSQCQESVHLLASEIDTCSCRQEHQQNDQSHGNITGLNSCFGSSRSSSGTTCGALCGGRNSSRGSILLFFSLQNLLIPLIIAVSLRTEGYGVGTGFRNLQTILVSGISRSDFLAVIGYNFDFLILRKLNTGNLVLFSVLNLIVLRELEAAFRLELSGLEDNIVALGERFLLSLDGTLIPGIVAISLRTEGYGVLAVSLDLQTVSLCGIGIDNSLAINGGNNLDFIVLSKLSTFNLVNLSLGGSSVFLELNALIKLKLVCLLNYIEGNSTRGSNSSLGLNGVVSGAVVGSGAGLRTSF